MTLPCGVVTPCPERVVTLITTLVLSPIFGGRRAGDDLHRLDRIERNLVGENFALLVGDGLAIDRERVLGVIAQPVEQAVGIGRDSRRGQRHQVN